MTDSKKPVVLLVEDSDDDAFFFKRTLQKSGTTCAVHHVTDGAKAVEFLRTTSTSNTHEFPKVMFLDLKMPVLNGFEVLGWLRTQSFPSQLPVIVLSGSELQSDKDRAAQLGASAYLVKPVKSQELQRFLESICPGNS